VSAAAAPSRRTATCAVAVLGEIGYLLQSRVGLQAEVTFLKSFGDDGFHIAELEDQDIQRMAELVKTYIDLPLGIVDTAVIAIAERLRLTEIATLEGSAGNFVSLLGLRMLRAVRAVGRVWLKPARLAGCLTGPGRLWRPW
jgi:predicted nucleic acid-binding protein